MKESENAIKAKILESYCQAKRSSIVVELRVKLGDTATIRLVDDFAGRPIYIPSKSSLRRAAMPMLIRAELQGLEPKSKEFALKVRELARFYKITKKVIKQINRKGVYSR